MDTQPLCLECPAQAVARLTVGSLGIQHDLCAAHLQARTRAYELALTPCQVTSLVRTPDRIEDAYSEVVHDLRESERATDETLRALDAANQKVARLELDTERLARRVTEEKLKVLERIESEQRLLDELEAERAKVLRLEPFEELAATLEAQLSGLERLTGIRRGADEREATEQGWPAAGQPGSVVESSERPSTLPPPTGR